MANSIFAAAQQADVNFELCRRSSFAKMLNRTIPTPTSDPRKFNKMWGMMEEYIPVTQDAIQQSIVNHMEYTLARTRFNFDQEDCYRATAYSVRDRLIETLNDTQQEYTEQDMKRCYYMSLEFLMGRAMQNALSNMNIEDPYKQALADLGQNLEELYEYEHDAALGNGGLGRLAACFMDSMATLNLPCWGYGIRYTYGIFEQKIVNGRQVEHPDYWLVQDNPWEVPRHDVTYAVRFFGESQPYQDEQDGSIRWRWRGGKVVQAMAHENPVPGFDTYNCNCLRLWKAAPSREFDFHFFNEGNYLNSVAERQDAEAISAVLYPNDNTDAGKLLRLKQQYFFCCATMQDCLRRFKRRAGFKWEELPNKMAVQLNDTHPTVAVAELMRILVDVECQDWDFAWKLTRGVFSYTNHTVLPEALEKWPVDLFGRLLPRHLQIVYELNGRFLHQVSKVYPGNGHIMSQLSMIEEGSQKMLRMANLAIAASSKVNGVAALHTQILKRNLFKTFIEFYDKCGEPEKVINITNGVTPRRWLHTCNRQLSDLISEQIGSDQWLTDFPRVSSLNPNDAKLVSRWREVKLLNKKRFAEWLRRHCSVDVNPETMLFDVQVKRIHEYKRQLLFILYMIYRSLTIKKIILSQGLEAARKQVQPRACMIGGKAAPGYAAAKAIIRLCCGVANAVNSDPQLSEFLRVIFMPNYNVSAAEVIIPGTDLSEQISTAGTEASGTSCMKFVMNGALIMGTLDGANVEIREDCGEDTMFAFGLKEHEVDSVRRKACRGDYYIDPRLAEVFTAIREGKFSGGDVQAQQDFDSLCNRLLNNGNGSNGDFYLIAADFADYCRAQDDVDRIYRDQPDEWTKTTIKAASRMGKFSSDRTIQEYASNIWKLATCAVQPKPSVTTTNVIPLSAAVTKPILATDDSYRNGQREAPPTATATTTINVNGKI